MTDLLSPAHMGERVILILRSATTALTLGAEPGDDDPICPTSLTIREYY
jgi:hypothetical protein